MKYEQEAEGISACAAFLQYCTKAETSQRLVRIQTLMQRSTLKQVNATSGATGRLGQFSVSFERKAYLTGTVQRPVCSSHLRQAASAAALFNVAAALISA